MKLLDEENNRLEHERDFAVQYDELEEDNSTSVSQSCCPFLTKVKRRSKHAVESVRRKWLKIFYPKWVKEQEQVYIQQLQNENNRKKKRRKNVPISRKNNSVKSTIEVSTSIYE